MSRDHYRGIPKTRNAVIKSDGTIAPLSKIDSEDPLSAPFLNVKHSNLGSTRVVICARATGNDSTGDGSLENPYRTLKRSLQDVPTLSDSTNWWIDITGIGTEGDASQTLVFPNMTSNAPRNYTGFVPNGGNFSTYENALNIYASLTVEEVMTITSSATQAASGLKNITDSSKSWTPGQFKGKFLVDSVGTSVGTVYNNDATTLYTTYTSAATGTISICDVSARLNYGAVGYTTSVYTSSTATLTFGGIDFDRDGAGGGFTSMASPFVDFTNCRFSHDAQVVGAASTSFANVHIKGSSLRTNSAATTFWSTYFENGYHHCFGDLTNGGFALGIRVEGNTKPMGHGTDTRVTGSWRYSNVSISGSTGDAISCNGGGWSQLDNTKIEYTGGDAVSVDYSGILRLKTVQGGQGVSGYGVNINNGGFVDAITSTNVSGTLGDINLGAVGVVSWSSVSGSGKLDLTPDIGTLSRIKST